MNPFTINSFYSIEELQASGYKTFQPEIKSAMVFTKNGSVFFFKKYPCKTNRVKFILASML